MDKKLFEKLADLRIEERKIKSQIETILPLIMAKIQEEEFENGTRIPVAQGDFTISFTRTYEYPSVIVAKQEEVDKLKKDAERTGEASYEEKPRLTFNITKHGEQN